jgi:hypothetical protein
VLASDREDRCSHGWGDQTEAEKDRTMSSMWPSVLGGLSAVAMYAVYVAGEAVIERRQIRRGREQLRARLFK